MLIEIVELEAPANQFLAAHHNSSNLAQVLARLALGFHVRGNQYRPALLDERAQPFGEMIPG